MAKFCNVCGNSVSERAIYCTACGNPLRAKDHSSDATEQPVSASFASETPITKAEATPSSPTPEPIIPPPAPEKEEASAARETASVVAPAPEKDTKAVSVGMYFLLLLLFSIPLIGWIAAIVFLCGATKNKNIRHLSAAYLLLILIGIIIAGVFILFFFLIFDTLLEYFDVKTFEDLINALIHHFD